MPGFALDHADQKRIPRCCRHRRADSGRMQAVARCDGADRRIAQRQCSRRRRRPWTGSRAAAPGVAATTAGRRPRTGHARPAPARRGGHLDRTAGRGQSRDAARGRSGDRGGDPRDRRRREEARQRRDIHPGRRRGRPPLRRPARPKVRGARAGHADVRQLRFALYAETVLRSAAQRRRSRARNQSDQSIQCPPALDAEPSRSSQDLHRRRRGGDHRRCQYRASVCGQPRNVLARYGHSARWPRGGSTADAVHADLARAGRRAAGRRRLFPDGAGQAAIRWCACSAAPARRARSTAR